MPNQARDHLRSFRPNRGGGRTPAAVDLNFKQHASKAHLATEDHELGERDYMEDLFWIRHDLGLDADAYWNR